MAHHRYLLISPDYPPPFVGGSLVYMYGLVENGEIAFDILTAPLPKNTEEVISSRHRPIRKDFIASSQNPSRYRLVKMYVGAVIWMLWNIRRYEAVVLNLGVVGNALLFILLRVFKTPTIGIAYAEELTISLKRSGLKGLIKKSLLRIGYPKASAFVVVCGFAKDILVSLGMDPGKISIIPPSVSPRKFEAVASLSRSPSFHILSVGRLIRRKGFHLLMDAVALLHGEIPNIRLTIVGHGDMHQELTEKMNQKQMKSYVSIRGEISDQGLKDLYREVDLFVLANIALENGDCEGCPTVLLEANAHGLPVIGGQEGGGATAIEDGYNGYLLDPRDVQNLASKIKHILTSPDLAQKMGKQGMVKVARDHDPKKAGIVFSDFIKSAVCS